MQGSRPLPPPTCSPATSPGNISHFQPRPKIIINLIERFDKISESKYLLSIDDFPVGLAVLLGDILADRDLLDVGDVFGVFFAVLDIYLCGSNASSSPLTNFRLYVTVWCCKGLKQLFL